MKGWKTVVFGALVAGLGSIQATDIATVVPADHVGIVMAAVGGIIMVLRALTSTSVGKKGDE